MKRSGCIAVEPTDNCPYPKYEARILCIAGGRSRNSFSGPETRTPPTGVQTRFACTKRTHRWAAKHEQMFEAASAARRPERETSLEETAAVPDPIQAVRELPKDKS
jgi:hypothetical protein